MDFTQSGQNDAGFLYPAVTNEELGDPDQIVVNYRRVMGHKRILIGLLVAGSLVWMWDYVRRGGEQRSHRA